MEKSKIEEAISKISEVEAKLENQVRSYQTIRRKLLLLEEEGRKVRKKLIHSAERIQTECSDFLAILPQVEVITDEEVRKFDDCQKAINRLYLVITEAKKI